MKLHTLIVVGAVAMAAFSPRVCVGEDQGKKAQPEAPAQSAEETISLEVTGMT
jgi:hypothetical protein